LREEQIEKRDGEERGRGEKGSGGRIQKMERK